MLRDAAGALHAYQGQDQFVIAYLQGMRDGFFLDSGASDGIRGSNTLALERDYGWRGACVEPNAALFERLCASRTVPCFNCCLSESAGDVPFLEAAGVYGGMMETYDPDFLASLRRNLPALGGEDAPLPVTSKPARTIAEVLVEADAPPVIDYWSLDVEGAELALLRAFPFDRYDLRVLTVEHNLTPAREQIRAFLETRGFVWACDLGIDDAYVRGPARRSAWQGSWRRKRT